MSNIPSNITRENKKLEHITKKYRKQIGTRNRTKDDPDLSLETLK